MQDINKRQRERESNRKHGRFVSRFEHTYSTSPPSHLKDFHYNRSHRITRCRNTYKEFPLELLDSLVPYTTQAHKLAEAAPQTKSSNTNSKPPRTHLSASSKYKDDVFGDHNTLIT